MSPSRLLVQLALLLFACAAHSDDSADWSVELLVGDAYDAASRTRIQQEQLGKHSFNGDFVTIDFIAKSRHA